MDWVSVCSRLLLAVVLGAAAYGKVRDRAGTAASLEAFRAPRALQRPGVWLLPLAEAVVALGLVFQPTARPAAVGGLVLLAVFTAAIAHVLRRGERPSCHCFGQVSDEPVNRWTLVRNGA